MFGEKSDLQTGSEYHDTLYSFIKKENEMGHISLKKYHLITFLKWGVLSLCFIFLFTFLSFVYSFFLDGSICNLIGTICFGSFLFITLLVLSFIPLSQQNQFESIEARFDDDSLLRLYTHGASDDVLDNIIRAFHRTGDLSYSQIYDIFWLCSRTSAGIEQGHLLGECYIKVKQKMRNNIFTREQGK